MLQRLQVENFKAWEKLDAKFGRVTGLFGTNSSGKSSLLQFLLLLKNTKNATDRGLVLDFGNGNNQLVNLGGFRDVVHKHDVSSALKWNITWELPNRVSISDPTKKRTDVLAADNTLGISAEARIRGTAPACESLRYFFGGYEFSIAPKKAGGTEYQLDASSPVGGDFRFVRNKQRAWALPGPVKTHLFPDQAKTYFQNADFLGVLESQYEGLMDSLYYLGPLREYPRRDYQWSGASPTDVGHRGEKTIEAILSSTARKEMRNVRYRSPLKPFEQMIAYWLKELGLIHEFRIVEIGQGSNIYRAMVRRDSKSTEALLTDVGFGVSQVLPALVLLYYVPEGSIILMEQPEIHLHPSVQSGLADVILTVSKSRNLQVVIESHSEHMLRRFQRRIAEEAYPSDELKIYFCDSVGGKSKLIDLDIDMFGEIRNWPKDFFGDEMHEIAQTRKAILKRKMEQQNQ